MTAPAVTFVDFESRSRADLDEVGPRRYWEHPSTRVICACFMYPDGSEATWLPGDGPVPQPDWLCAHNLMGFDRFAWARMGWPKPRRLVDTLELAKVAGYSPVSLDALFTDLLGIGKDLEGNAFTIALSAPSQYYSAEALDLEAEKAAWRAAHPKGSGMRLPTAQLKAARIRELDAYGEAPRALTPEEVARVVKYCQSDVRPLAELYDVFLRQWLDSDLPGLEQADRALNDRGIHFDVPLARLLIDACEGLATQALEAAGFGPDQAIEVSPARLKARLAVLGVDLPDYPADTLEAALPTAPAEAQALIRARQGVSSIAAGKLRAGLARVCPDGKLRDNRTYMGAHTGRWSGKGMQLDNLAKGE